MTQWQKFKKFISKNWQVLVGIFGAVVGLICLLVLRRRSGSTPSPIDLPEVKLNEQDIAELNKRRGDIVEKVSKVDLQIDELDSTLQEDTKNLRLRKKRVKKMSLADKVRRFRDLGY